MTKTVWALLYLEAVDTYWGRGEVGACGGLSLPDGERDWQNSISSTQAWAGPLRAGEGTSPRILIRLLECCNIMG